VEEWKEFEIKKWKSWNLMVHWTIKFKMMVAMWCGRNLMGGAEEWKELK